MERKKYKDLSSSENGYAVAEFAVTIPILVSVVSICFWVIGISINKFQIENYANQAARIIARGETIPEDYLFGAPRGMILNVEEKGSRIKVETRLVVKIPILGKEIELASEAENISEIYVAE